MNFQALTQAARNVFREWFTAIRSHGPILMKSYEVLTLVMYKRGMAILFPVPFVVTLLAGVLTVDIFLDSYPPRSGNGYIVASAFATIFLFMGAIAHMVLWMVSIDNAIKHRNLETYSSN